MDKRSSMHSLFAMDKKVVRRDDQDVSDLGACQKRSFIRTGERRVMAMCLYIAALLLYNSGTPPSSAFGKTIRPLTLVIAT